MGSVNKAIIIGNIGRDAEVNHTQSGKSVCNFSVATSNQWTDGAGEKQERTEWHRVVMWGKVVDALGQYLTKGKTVYVEGPMETRKWEDKDGNERWTTEIRGLKVVLLGGGGRKSETTKVDQTTGELTEDSIPF